MKYIIITIILFFLAPNFTDAQFSQILAKKWKVAEVFTILTNKKVVNYHMDSLTNTLEYSKVYFTFDTSGTYKVGNTMDTSNKSGTWSIKNSGDSILIDDVSFSLVKLSPDSFLTKGYSLYLANNAGKFDTAYNFLRLYSVATDILPTELSSLGAKFLGNRVQVRWTTETEANNKQFEIEASHTGTTFEKIGTMPGNPNSSLHKAYVFDDLSFFKAGKNYYRLKQIDLDGRYKMSGTIIINVEESKEALISIYPNPATNRIVLNSKRPIGNRIQLILTDGTGRNVWSKTLPGNNTLIPVMLPHLSKGIYIISIINYKGEKLLTDKLTIQ